MKFTCSQRKLLKALTIADKTIWKRGHLDILKSVKVEAVDDHVEITATDREVWTTSQITAHIDAFGVACIDLADLIQAVKSLDDGDIEFELARYENSTEVDMKQQSRAFAFTSLDPCEFPPRKTLTEAISVDFKPLVLKNLLDSVVYATYPGVDKRTIGGVHVACQNDNLTFVATDTHRMAVTKSSAVEYQSHIQMLYDFAINVPLKTVKMALFMQPRIKPLTNVNWQFNDTTIVITLDNCTITSLLTEGTYPNWQRVVPAETTQDWHVETKALKDAIKQIAPQAAASKCDRMFMESIDTTLTLSAKHPEDLEATAIALPVASNGDFKIAFNYKYVLDALNSIDTQDVQFLMTKWTTPAVLRELHNPDRFCVIMPVSLNG